MQAFHDQIATWQRDARVGVITPPPALVFSPRDLPIDEEKRLTRSAIAIAAGLLSLGR